MGRVRAYIGLGANVGDAAATLAAAVHALAALPDAELVAVSRLYATEPVGVLDQPEFRNAVVAHRRPARARPGDRRRRRCWSRSRASSGPSAARRGERWGPREVDLDILLFGDAADRGRAARRRAGATTRPRPTSPLVVPHVEARNRLFVLAPLADLAPEPACRRAGTRRSPTPRDAASTARARTPSGRSRPGTARAGARSADGQSRTAGGRSRSNMWTVSTNRTCLLW